MMKDIQNLNAEIHTIAFSSPNTSISTQYNTTLTLHVFYVFIAGVVVKMMVTLWFSQCTVKLCFDISDGNTALTFTMIESGSHGYQMEDAHPSQMSAKILSTQYEHPTKNLHLHINFLLIRMQAVQFCLPYASTRMWLVTWALPLLYQHEIEHFSVHNDVNLQLTALMGLLAIHQYSYVLIRFLVRMSMTYWKPWAHFRPSLSQECAHVCTSTTH